MSDRRAILILNGEPLRQLSVAVGMQNVWWNSPSPEQARLPGEPGDTVKYMGARFVMAGYTAEGEMVFVCYDPKLKVVDGEIGAT